MAIAAAGSALARGADERVDQRRLAVPRRARHQHDLPAPAAARSGSAQVASARDPPDDAMPVATHASPAHGPSPARPISLKRGAVSAFTGATKRYPLRCTVSMNAARRVVRQRLADLAHAHFDDASLTTTSCHTLSSNSSLVTRPVGAAGEVVEDFQAPWA
jgi:hypothetical protein